MLASNLKAGRYKESYKSQSPQNALSVHLIESKLTSYKHYYIELPPSPDTHEKTPDPNPELLNNILSRFLGE